MRRLLALLGALISSAALVAPALATHTVTVWSGDMDGWEFNTTDDGTPPNTATATFVAGPATPPLGAGSVQLAVGANGASGAEVRNADYEGTALADLTELSYATYVSVEGSGGQAPYIILAIDTDNDSASDDLLFFEPTYQDGTYAGDPVPDQGDVTVDTWQTWDAFVGGWWSLDAGTFGPPLVTLDTYITANPDATIVNQSSGGGVRFVAGFGAPAWNNFVGNVDAVVVGTTEHVTTFDFEVAGPPSPSESPAESAAPSPADDDETLPDTAAEENWVATGAIVAVGVLVVLVSSALSRRRGRT